MRTDHLEIRLAMIALGVLMIISMVWMIFEEFSARKRAERYRR